MTGVRIGVFDSGLGGLSVVRALYSARPGVGIVYFADTAHVPYGDRPLNEVRGFALGIVDYLLSEGAGAILMACNISSAVALDDARSRHPGVPMAGVIEAGARAAARLSQERIAVLATAGTVASGGYLRALAREAPASEIIQTACPKFVPLVEDGRLTGSEVEEAARQYLRPGLEAGARVFILGCTHYPFLKPALQTLAPAGTVFVDPAEEAVREILIQVGDNLQTQDGSRFVLSAPSETFRPVGSRFLGAPMPELELARWSENQSLSALSTGSQVARL